MEFFLVVPLLMVMGGAAIYFALSERPVPSITPASLLPPVRVAGTATHTIDHEIEDEVEAETGEPDSFDGMTINQSDVLLADALTEMLEIKDEIGRLRGQVHKLEEEVQQLSSSRQPARRSRRSVADNASPSTGRSVRSA